MSKKRVINCVAWVALAAIVITTAVMEWMSQGASGRSLVLAVAFYGAMIGGLGLYIDRILKDKEGR